MPRSGTLPTVLAGVFITVLDFFIVNVAIPSTQRDLHAGPTATEWVVAGYALAYGSGLILGGRLGDVHGRRRMFSLGTALFTLASVACGLAPTATALVVARVAQGAAAALLSPQVLAIIRTAYSGPARSRAVNAYALTMGLAAVFGQLIGGVLIHADLFGLGWRACFLLNVPIGITVLAVARRMVPESRAADAARLDLPGAALITSALAATLLPLIEGREQGWPAWTWVSFAASAALFTVFGRRRLPHSPLIDPALFRQRAFVAGLFTYLAFTMGMAAYFLIFALYVQQGRGLDALEAGFAFVPIGAGYLAASLLAPRLAARLGRQVIAIGGLTRAVGLAALLVMAGQGAAVGWLVPALIVDGIGMGLALGPIMTTVLAGVAQKHAGSAASALTTVQQVGGALGVGAVGIVYYGSVGDGVPLAFRHGLIHLIVVALVLTALVQLLPRGAGKPSALEPSAREGAPA
ncbi:MFS transporter [Streptomyces sp. A0642]|uniref:MFS transporter n=1 Tax=Streptomyces sp. A0642 TaxID=2563100 RepID=UPI0010A25E49|nr:MFS transporter [Streptomyces sp. A0642]THA78970.1 MFS transporter [Streptomyces sp. A0642]